MLAFIRACIGQTCTVPGGNNDLSFKYNITNNADDGQNNDISNVIMVQVMATIDPSRAVLLICFFGYRGKLDLFCQGFYVKY
jgi:hypothetical protein